MAQSTTGADSYSSSPQPSRARPTHPQAHTLSPFYPKQITSRFLSPSANEQPSWTGIKGVFTQPFLPPQRGPQPPPCPHRRKSRCR